MYTKLSAVAALVVAGAFVATGTASAGQANAASSSRLRATPVAMASHITNLGYPYTHAVCHGRGKRKDGNYGAFRCAARGTVRGVTRSWTVWAKPLSRGWCGSAWSLKTCHRLTAPVYGSEDKCNGDPGCSDSSDTLVAIARRLGAAATLHDRAPYCQPSGTNVYDCNNARGPSFTVAWTKASYGWLPTVTQTS